MRVEHRIASLQLLCQQGIATAVKEEKDVAKLTMPSRLCSYVTAAFVPTIKVMQHGEGVDIHENPQKLSVHSTPERYSSTVFI